MAEAARRGPAPRQASEGSVRSFIYDIRSELRKVNWPTREEVQNLTLLVVAVSVAVGVVLGGIDYVFAKLFEWLLRAT